MRHLPEEQWRIVWNWLIYDHMSLPGSDRKPVFDAVLSVAAKLSPDILQELFYWLWPYEAVDGEMAQEGLDAMMEIADRFPSHVVFSAARRVADSLGDLSAAGRKHALKEILGTFDRLESGHVLAIVNDLVAASALLPAGRGQGYVPILRRLGSPATRLDAAHRRSLAMAMVRKLCTIETEEAQTESFHALMAFVAGMPHDQQVELLTEATASTALRPVDEHGAERFDLLLSTIRALPAALRGGPLQALLRANLDLFLRRLDPETQGALRRLMEQLQALGASGKVLVEQVFLDARRGGLGDARASLFGFACLKKVAQRS